MTEITQEEIDAKIQQLRTELAADGRKLVTVRRIAEINDIPGADLIKVATVDGWKVVVKADEFKPGDLCVFFEIDTFILASDTRFEFLMQNKITWHGIEGARLKTIRLRKQLSQGLALPVSLFPEIQKWITPPVYDPISGNVGIMNEDGESDQVPLGEMNFSGVVGVLKWEKILSADQQANVKDNFPSFIPKSDQPRCQNFLEEIFHGSTFELNGKWVSKQPVPDDLPAETLLGMLEGGHLAVVDHKYHVIRGDVEAPAKYEVSLKLDGSSMTVYTRGREGQEFSSGICSRNYDLKLDDVDAQFVAQGLPIIQFLKQHPKFWNFAFQGELMGPGIQQNRENFLAKRFFVYNIYDVTQGEFLTPNARMALIDEMNTVAGATVFSHVPVLFTDVTMAELGITGIDELLKFAEGPSISHPVREGLVFKEMSGRHQFKVISNKYLEKEKE